MKTILFIAFFGLLSLGAVAENNTLKFYLLNDSENSIPAFRPIDITIYVNGYTVHIYGTVSFNPFTGNSTINATLTITGNGTNLSIPISYSGSLNGGRGVNTNEYDDRKIEEEDKPVVEMIMSHVYLPRDQDPKKVRVDQFEKQ